MNTSLEKEGLKDLKEIKDELIELKNLQAGYPHSFVSGLMSGAGWIFGGIIAIAVIGWFLSIIGFIPGLGEMANYLHGLVDTFNAARH